MNFLAWIEALPPVSALKSSFLAYPLVNALHILAVGALVTLVWLIDLRVLGRLAAFDAARFVTTFRRVALCVFAVVLVTGVALFSVRAREYVHNPAFLTKMGIILLAALNFLVFDAAARRNRDRPGFSAAERGLAVASLALWPSILFCGRLIGFL